MEWLVEFGPRQELLEKMAKSSGKVPTALAAKPTLLPRAGRFWTPYLRLTGSRGMNGMIPLSEIVVYADNYGFRAKSAKQDLIRFVGVCDQAYAAVKERTRGSGVGT